MSGKYENSGIKNLNFSGKQILEPLRRLHNYLRLLLFFLCKATDFKNIVWVILYALDHLISNAPNTSKTKKQRRITLFYLPTHSEMYATIFGNIRNYSVVRGVTCCQRGLKVIMEGQLKLPLVLLDPNFPSRILIPEFFLSKCWDTGCVRLYVLIASIIAQYWHLH